MTRYLEVSVDNYGKGWYESEFVSHLHEDGRHKVMERALSAPMLAVAKREGRIEEAFLRDLNAPLEMEAECYDMLASTGTFTHGHVGAGCLPGLLALLVPGGRLICTVHRDVWDEGGFGSGLQALTDAGVAILRSREADRLFEDDDEPTGWYLVVEKRPA